MVFIHVSVFERETLICSLFPEVRYFLERPDNTSFCFLPLIFQILLLAYWFLLSLVWLLLLSASLLPNTYGTARISLITLNLICVVLLIFRISCRWQTNTIKLHKRFSAQTCFFNVYFKHFKVHLDK